MDDQEVIARLNANWVWVADWQDCSQSNTAGRIVRFTRFIDLDGPSHNAQLHFSADTRYKLYINGSHVAVGPHRSSPYIWYYDSHDIASHLIIGRNEITFIVVRYFAANRAAMPFERTSFPGLTVTGSIETAQGSIIFDSNDANWTAEIDETISFPVGLIDDGFLHISERVSPSQSPPKSVVPKRYGFKTLNGDLLPWRLRPTGIPIPEVSPVAIDTIRRHQSDVEQHAWQAALSGRQPVLLPAESSHTLEVQAEAHSTAFLKWTFRATAPTKLQIKATYSEGYELDPRSYPFFRTKGDRLDAENGKIIGPFDEVTLDIDPKHDCVYEPFWFRTFRLIRLEVTTGSAPVEFVSLAATQINYPLAVKARWNEPDYTVHEDVWSVSIRTLRNCMFDGYSDCPFYEQLQYSMDSRAVGLFHYFLSGDDRLMRQAITNFAASVTSEGLTQSRFPSHVNQLIAAFPLYWILQICDHHLFFGDSRFARSFLPRIDGVLEFFEAYIDDRGLVSNLPSDVWQFVDWVTTWHATDEHPDKGVPTSGRRSNLHTYFSLVLAYVLQEAAKLVRNVGRPGHANEYESRARSLQEAVRKHCYDGRFFTDSTADISTDASSYSQHCQVWAVLSGTAHPSDRVRLLTEAFEENSVFSKCSYMMLFYAFRAFSLAGDHVYETLWPRITQPWRGMLKNNLSTWEEDDVRQRSDCHAWGSVPIYEFCAEIAGLSPIAPGANRILFKPRLALTSRLEAKVALGCGNVGSVSWSREREGGSVMVRLALQKAVDVVYQLPGGERVEVGITDSLSLEWHG